MHLDCWSIKILFHFCWFCLLWFWPFGSFVLWRFCPFLLFSVRPRDHMTRCWLSTPVSCDHLIVHLDCWSIKIFSHFCWFCPLWFWSFWGFRPMVLLSIFAFLCSPPWSHIRNVDYPHLYHVIMGSYTLIVGVLKYFLMFGDFVRFDSDPLVLSSYGAFVHFSFSLSTHVITWRECWWSTPVSCDHDIVHLDCWSIKIFSQFWLFCPLWFWSLVLSSYSAFVNFWFSLSPHVIA